MLRDVVARHGPSSTRWTIRKPMHNDRRKSRQANKKTYTHMSECVKTMVARKNMLALKQVTHAKSSYISCQSKCVNVSVAYSISLIVHISTVSSLPFYFIFFYFFFYFCYFSFSTPSNFPYRRRRAFTQGHQPLLAQGHELLKLNWSWEKEFQQALGVPNATYFPSRFSLFLVDGAHWEPYGAVFYDCQARRPSPCCQQALYPGQELFLLFLYYFFCILIRTGSQWKVK